MVQTSFRIFGVAIIFTFFIFAQPPAKPTEIKGYKNILISYDKFHDETTVFTKPFPSGAYVGQKDYVLMINSGYVFQGKEAKEKPETILFYFDPEASGFMASYVQHQNSKRDPSHYKVFFNHKAEVIAMVGEERISLPRVEKEFRFNGRGDTEESIIIPVSVENYSKIAMAEKPEIMIGDVIVKPYLKRYGERMKELLRYIQEQSK